jgi:hypothetical protein
MERFLHAKVHFSGVVNDSGEILILALHFKSFSHYKFKFSANAHGRDQSVFVGGGTTTTQAICLPECPIT